MPSFLQHLFTTTPILFLLLLFTTTTIWSAHAYVSGVPQQQIDRRALAGLWKLTPSVLPLKEFTVKRNSNTKTNKNAVLASSPENNVVLLMLKADGSFTRMESLETDEDDEEESSTTRQQPSSTTKDDIDQSWKDLMRDHNTHTTTTLNHKEPIQTLFQGTWDYRDGQLILAADRDEKKARSDNFGYHAENTERPKSDDEKPSKGMAAPDAQQQQQFWNKRGKDTLLMGTVVATTTSAAPPPKKVQEEKHQVTEEASSTATTTTSSQQTISVPVGSVNVGTFFYPKHHPSFFDQPMFSPERSGSFQLQQVLRSASAERDREETPMEKFRVKDFHGKRFFLTTHPLKQRRPKGNIRWSIKYNKFVEDPPSKEAKAQQDAEQNRPVPIRVMKVMIHANNTFSTIAGLGDTTILRGNFNVIGDKRDQVWMQSLRFGFGRKVSGSTYSEGNALGEETKSFWGKISYEEDKDKINNDLGLKPPAMGESSDERTTKKDPAPQRLQVEGSVIVGWGLEPEPVARFIMKEAEDDADFVDDYDVDVDEEEEDGTVLEDDWSNGDAFQ